jgi:uncharacterized integral membrane protein
MQFQAPENKGRLRQMVKTKLIAAFVLTVLIIILVLQNTTPVETKFLLITATMPLAALLTITMLLGIAVGFLISLSLAGKRDNKVNSPTAPSM